MISKFLAKCLVAVSVFVAGTQNTFGEIVYDETVNGDLSGSFDSPTSVTLGSGNDSTIVAQVGDNGGFGATDGSDADYFEIVVLPGSKIVSFAVDAYTVTANSGGEGDAGFGSLLAYSADPFTGQGLDDIDSFILFGSASGDILPQLTNGLGIDGTLDPGTHRFWIQETADDVTVDYQLTLTSIPEPSSALLGAAAVGVLVIRRKR